MFRYLMKTSKEISEFHDQYLANPSWPDDFILQYQASNKIDALIEAINAELAKSEYTNCVVFLDTVSRCIPGIDENLSKDMIN